MGRTNPYSPPRLRPARSRASSVSVAALEGLLVATAVVSVFRTVLYLQALLHWDLLALSGSWVETASRASWLLSLVLLAAAVVAYCVWIHRTNRAVRERGYPLELTPAWSVAVSFVPFVNLVGPYRVVDELRASVAVGGRLVVRAWWASWIASLGWSLASRFASSDLLAAWRAPVHDGLWAASALCLLVAVRAIERGLERERSTGSSRLGSSVYAH